MRYITIYDKCYGNILNCMNLFLFQLHQYAIAIFWMQKHDRFAVSSYPRILTQTPNILTLDIRDSSVDVIDLDTNVMNASRLILLQEPGNWRFLSQRMKQLQFSVWQLYKHCCHTVLRKILKMKYFLGEWKLIILIWWLKDRFILS